MFEQYDDADVPWLDQARRHPGVVRAADDTCGATKNGWTCTLAPHDDTRPHRAATSNLLVRVRATWTDDPPELPFVGVSVGMAVAEAVRARRPVSVMGVTYVPASTTTDRNPS